MAQRGEVQRWVSVLVGAGVIAFAAWLALNGTEKRPHHDVDAGSEAGAPVIAITAPTTIADDTDGGAKLELGAFFDAGSLDKLPNGAPRSVHIGVVLVQYNGAEGAPASARSRKDALARAEQLAEVAKTDFKKAVKDGDSGSGDDIGRIPRGVLDPHTEVAVFSLGANEISTPLETPRGYWIVKRLE